MKTQQQVLFALDEWLETRGLSFHESVMIRTLRNALKSRGLPEFKLATQHVFRAMPEIVKSAIAKARSQGILREWPHAS